MTDEARHLRRRKARRRRAAARRLQPIRGEAGRRLRSRSIRPRRVVGVGQLARGLSVARTRARSRAVAWVLTALPAVVLVVWVLARLARHV